MNKNTPEPFFDFSEVAGIMHPGCRICGKAIFAVDPCMGHPGCHICGKAIFAIRPDEPVYTRAEIEASCMGHPGDDEDYLIGEDADRMVKAMKEDAE